MATSYRLSTEEAKKNALYALSMCVPGDNTIVTFKDEKESRSDAQHRLRWVWFTQMEKELAGVGKGRSREQWNLFYKNLFMPQILIAQDDDFESVFRTYKETLRLLHNKPKQRNTYMMQFWYRVVSTKDMNVASMSDWLSKIEDDALHDKNIVLKIPEDLQWLKN